MTTVIDSQVEVLFQFTGLCYFSSQSVVLWWAAWPTVHHLQHRAYCTWTQTWNKRLCRLTWCCCCRCLLQLYVQSGE